MRSSKFVRFGICTGLVLALFTGLVTTVSAQASTPESTPAATSEPTAAATESMMDQMMSMEGACPRGIAGSMFRAMELNMTPEATMSATESMATPMATMDMSSMTAEATEMMGATAEATSMMGVTCLFGTFSGSAEVPAAADSAMGVVFVSIDPSSGNICYDEAIGGITLPATKSHIHQAAAGTSGPVVVPFDVAPDKSGMASSCVTATPDLANQIASNPSGFYVNVHNADFPNGAARAQLQAWDVSMLSSMTPAATTSP